MIDSRTGVSDIGSICTVQLPDIVVALFTANEQSLEGVLQVVHRADERREEMALERSRLRVLPVASRFEGTVEVDRAREWLDRFAERLQPLFRPWVHKDVAPRRLIDHLLVPYVARWSFGEELPVVDEGTSNPLTVGYALETLAAVLGNHLERSNLLIDNRQAYVDSAQYPSDGETREFTVAIVETAKERDLVAALRDALSRRGVRVAPDFEEALTASQNLVAVVGEGPTRSVEESVRRFLLAAAGTEDGGGVIPVLRVSDRWAVPLTLQSFQPLEARDLHVDSIAAEVHRRLLERTVASRARNSNTFFVFKKLCLCYSTRRFRLC